MPTSTAATGLALFAAACAIGAAAAEQHKPSVRVFVYAAAPAPGPGQGTDAGRAEAVGDIRDALDRKAGLEMVDDRASADVLIEVIGREEREGPAGGFGGVSMTKLGDFIIRLRLHAGDEEADLKGMGQGTWGRAARDAADRVLKWIARRERPRAATRQSARSFPG